VAINSLILGLAFVGKEFHRGIVRNEALPFGKDAAYELLKRPSHNGAKYYWFCFPKVMYGLHRYAPVIGMVKKTSKVL